MQYLIIINEIIMLGLAALVIVEAFSQHKQNRHRKSHKSRVWQYVHEMDADITYDDFCWLYGIIRNNHENIMRENPDYVPTVQLAAEIIRYRDNKTTKTDQ